MIWTIKQVHKVLAENWSVGVMTWWFDMEWPIDDNDGQMIFGDLGGLKLPDICLTGEEKPLKNITQETCPDGGSNPGLLRDKRACYHLPQSTGPHRIDFSCNFEDIFC